VTGADAGHAAGKNLAAFLHELGKNVGALVVDQVYLLDAELANLLLAEKLALAAARSAGTAAGSTGTARAAFTASATPATGSTFATATTAMAAVPTARTAFAARRRSHGRCLCCCYWILFV
jgi:hypothetical protein